MKIAITGGIGSGKSFVSNLLKNAGTDVYDCDKEAKRLMHTSQELQEKLSALIGRKICNDGGLDKRAIAEFLLHSEHNKQKINSIVHPAVAADFLASGKEWLESAILFESGFCHRIHFDYIVCVTAPLKVRAARVALRDNISTDKARQWIESQLPQKQMEEQSDFIINNDGKANVNEQLENILQILTKQNY